MSARAIFLSYASQDADAASRICDALRMAGKAAAEAVRLNPNLRLDIKDDIPWPGKEAAYRKYIETQYLPAWRFAGLPE